jgi:hypothetical protein
MPRPLEQHEFVFTQLRAHKEFDPSDSERLVKEALEAPHENDDRAAAARIASAEELTLGDDVPATFHIRTLQAKAIQAWFDAPRDPPSREG